MRYQIVTKNGKYWIQEKGWCTVRPPFIARNVFESQEAAETALTDYLKEPDLVKEYERHEQMGCSSRIVHICHSMHGFIYRRIYEGDFLDRILSSKRQTL